MLVLSCAKSVSGCDPQLVIGKGFVQMLEDSSVYLPRLVVFGVGNSPSPGDTGSKQDQLS